MIANADFSDPDLTRTKIYRIQIRNQAESWKVQVCKVKFGSFFFPSPLRKVFKISFDHLKNYFHLIIR